MRLHLLQGLGQGRGRPGGQRRVDLGGQQAAVGVDGQAHAEAVLGVVLKERVAQAGPFPSAVTQ